MSKPEYLVRTKDLYPGPRKDLIERIDRTLAQEALAMDKAIDDRNFPAALSRQATVKYWREIRQWALDAPILEIIDNDNLD